MKPTPPNRNDWKRLYDAAITLKKIHPWTWMSDADLFGVRHPDTGEIGYCSIMGELGQVYALALYPGDEALQGYLKLQTGEIDYEDVDALHIQTCLMASFEDRKDIDKTDYGIIKSLGLKFRGRNAWPLFRSFRPGYLPWYLTKSEARFLTLGLQQAVYVSRRFREDGNRLRTDRKKGRIPVREPGANHTWTDAAVEIPFLEDRKPVLGPVDEIRLRRIKNSATRIGEVWEIGSFYFPNAVAEGGRPYFPKALIVIDHETEMALHHFLGTPEAYQEAFRADLLALVEKAGKIPNQIWVDQPENREIFGPIAEGLGIRLDIVDWLPGVEEFKEGIFDSFLEDPDGED